MASGSRPGAKFASTAQLTINGPPKPWDNTSAICRKTSSFSPAPSLKILLASRHSPDSEAVIAAAKAAGVHDLIVSMPEGYGTPIGEQGHRFPPVKRNGSRSHARFMATLSWWCSTNLTQISMPKAMTRSRAQSSACARATELSLSSHTGQAQSPASISFSP